MNKLSQAIPAHAMLTDKAAQFINLLRVLAWAVLGSVGALACLGRHTHGSFTGLSHPQLCRHGYSNHQIGFPNNITGPVT